MKRLGFSSLVAFLLLISVVIMAAQPARSAQGLAIGECLANPDSKIYLTAAQGSASLQEKLIQDLGKDRFFALVNTADQHFYFCSVECRMSESQQISIWVIHRDRPEHFSDMNGFLCKGVVIENVNIVGSIYGPKPVPYPFWSFESGSDEIQERLARMVFRLSSDQEQYFRFRMRKALREIVPAYLASSATFLKEAGVKLNEIDQQSDQGQALEKAALKILIENHWQIHLLPVDPDYYVHLAIKTYGRFLEYSSSEF